MRTGRRASSLRPLSVSRQYIAAVASAGPPSLRRSRGSRPTPPRKTNPHPSDGGQAALVGRGAWTPLPIWR